MEKVTLNSLNARLMVIENKLQWAIKIGWTFASIFGIQTLFSISPKVINLIHFILKW